MICLYLARGCTKSINWNCLFGSFFVAPVRYSCLCNKLLLNKVWFKRNTLSAARYLMEYDLLFGFCCANLSRWCTLPHKSLAKGVFKHVCWCDKEKTICTIVSWQLPIWKIHFRAVINNVVSSVFQLIIQYVQYNVKTPALRKEIAEICWMTFYEPQN